MFSVPVRVRVEFSGLQGGFFHAKIYDGATVDNISPDDTCHCIMIDHAIEADVRDYYR
jgi:hypothetical protein